MPMDDLTVKAMRVVPVLMEISIRGEAGSDMAHHHISPLIGKNLDMFLCQS